MTDADRLNRRLQSIYDELPTIDCLGLCHNTCNNIPMTKFEHRRILNETGYDIRRTDRPCPALSPVGRCNIHPIRPYICRLMGLSERGLACEYGCEPSRRLTLQEAYRLQNKLDWLMEEISTERYKIADQRLVVNPEIAEQMAFEAEAKIGEVGALLAVFKKTDGK